LVFQYSFSSDVFPGIGRDAEYIGEHIAKKRRSADREKEKLLAA
jgi:hypothetical protein